MNPSRVVLFAVLTALAACSQVQPPAADTTFSLAAQTLGTGAEDRGRELALSSSGALYVAGSTRGSLDFPNKGGKDIFLRRYNPDKTLVWKRQIASRADDIVKDLAADSSGQLYVGGRQGRSCFHGKYSASGTLLWKRSYTVFCSDMAMAVDTVGNIYLTEDRSVGAEIKYELRKFNSSGSQVYATTFSSGNGLGGHGVKALAVDSGGNTYAMASDFDDDAWCYIVKVGPTGEQIASAWTGDLNCWRGGSMQVVGNALYAVGHKDYLVIDPETGDEQVAETDISVKKLSLGLNWLWERTFGTRLFDTGTAVTADAAGNVYAVGVTRGGLVGPNAGNDDVVVRKYSASGATQWTKQFGNASFDVASDAVATGGRSAALYLTGATGGALEGGTHRGGLDAFLLRRNGLGNKVWTDQ